MAPPLKIPIDGREQLLRQALTQTRGLVGAAAVLLGVCGRTLVRYLERHGIDYRDYRAALSAVTIAARRERALALNRQRAHRHRLAGLCIRCPAPAERGRTRCRVHLDEAALQSKKRWALSHHR